MNRISPLQILTWSCALGCTFLSFKYGFHLQNSLDGEALGLFALLSHCLSIAVGVLGSAGNRLVLLLFTGLSAAVFTVSGFVLHKDHEEHRKAQRELESSLEVPDKISALCARHEYDALRQLVKEHPYTVVEALTTLLDFPTTEGDAVFLDLEPLVARNTQEDVGEICSQIVQKQRRQLIPVLEKWKHSDNPVMKEPATGALRMLDAAHRVQ